MDQLTCGLHKKVIFLVKSDYQSIKQWEDYDIPRVSVHNNLPPLWSKLWKISTVLKHVHLAWRILNDILSVKKKLIQKCMLSDLFCQITFL